MIRTHLIRKMALFSMIGLSFQLVSAEIDTGIVNFRKVIEESKLGKQEQVNFESLKKQVESILEEKEKALSDLAAKLQDADYMDGLSPEKENDLKFEFRNKSQEMQQLQGQFYQSLNQANMKIIQKMNEEVSKAAKKVAEKNKLALILNQDSSFFHKDSLDVSKQIVEELDKTFVPDEK